MRWFVHLFFLLVGKKDECYEHDQNAGYIARLGALSKVKVVSRCYMYRCFITALYESERGELQLRAQGKHYYARSAPHLINKQSSVCVVVCNTAARLRLRIRRQTRGAR